MTTKQNGHAIYPSIVFMGTPGFAVPPLNALHRAGFGLPWVVTQPDRPKGRGRQLTPSPVKRRALELGYRVLQPENIRRDSFLDQLAALAPDFLVVVAFGQILPQAVLDIPKLGAINVHASLLPKYRGPAPIQWAMMRGETETGITTILMDHGVDTGDMLMKAAIPIKPDDTAASLHDRLALLGADLLVNTLKGILDGSVRPRAQMHDQATYAPMLKKENGRINWQQPAQRIDAMIRAMTPWPGAYCIKGDRRYKIHKARPLPDYTEEPPGTVIRGFPDELRIATGQGVLSVLEIQGASGKRMSIRTFLHGHPLKAGEKFS